MNRATVGLDRFLGVVVGVLLIVVGAAGILWWHGTLHRRAPAVGVHTHGVLLSLRNATDQSWWPWVAGLVGLVLGVLALLWLLRHATYRRGADPAAAGERHVRPGDRVDQFALRRRRGRTGPDTGYPGGPRQHDR